MLIKDSGHYWQLLKLITIVKPFLITCNRERLITVWYTAPSEVAYSFSLCFLPLFKGARVWTCSQTRTVKRCAESKWLREDQRNVTAYVMIITHTTPRQRFFSQFGRRFWWINCVHTFSDSALYWIILLQAIFISHTGTESQGIRFS